MCFITVNVVNVTSLGYCLQYCLLLKQWLFCPLVCWLLGSFNNYSTHYLQQVTLLSAFIEDTTKCSPLWLFFRISRKNERLPEFPTDRQTNPARIPSPNFGESRFSESSQIPFPVKIFCVFQNPAPYFGQILDPENTLPDPGQTTALAR